MHKLTKQLRMNRLPVVAAILVLAGITAVPAFGRPSDDLPTGMDAVIHGAEARAGLKLAFAGKPFFDVNGDGYKDFLVKYWTRASHPDLRHEHLDIVFGRATWPAESGVSSLDGRLIIALPDPHDYLPGEPLYALMTNQDLNGDRVDDLVFKKTELRRVSREGGDVDVVTAVELRVYYGRSDFGRTLDPVADTPDMVIRQSKPPRTSLEELRTPMPEQVSAADLNGDGERDLIISSCALRREGHTSQSDGALLVWFGPYKKVMELSADAADMELHSSGEIDVCTASAINVDGDDASELLFKGIVKRSGRDYRYGAVVYGRTDWAPESDVADLVEARFVDDDPDADVAVRVSDMNGDRKRDIVGEVSVYSRSGWDDKLACVWFVTGQKLVGDITTANCDYTYPGLWPQEAVDINGDGALDYQFAPEHRGSAPFVWLYAMGPMPEDGVLLVEASPDTADHVMEHPFRLDPFSMRWANVGGSSANDHLMFEAQASHSAPEDGRIEIHFGPILAPPPTAVPTEEPTAAPTDEPTPVPTAVPTEEPTAVPTAEPTEVPAPPTIYLPVCKRVD